MFWVLGLQYTPIFTPVGMSARVPTHLKFQTGHPTEWSQLGDVHTSQVCLSHVRKQRYMQ